jgi:hypothetical protein
MAGLQTSDQPNPPNAVLVVSDGVEARVGALGAGREWFKPWRTISGKTLAGAQMPELQVVTTSKKRLEHAARLRQGRSRASFPDL